MKIVNLQTFRTLPSGTIFMKYAPCYFEALSVKGDTLEHDFVSGEMAAPVDANDSGEWADKLFEAAENGTSVGLDFDCYGRDGCFEDKQLFAVYEKEDMEKLIAKLQECVKDVERWTIEEKEANESS